MKTTILEGPDGQLYEIPDDQLAAFAVPGHKVMEIRTRMAARAGGPGAGDNGAGAPRGHYRLGELPPDHPGFMAQHELLAAQPHADAAVEGYHMSFDENGIPTNHTDMLWGDYIDKQGNPAVGFHSHDPVSGNAQ